MEEHVLRLSEFDWSELDGGETSRLKYVVNVKRTLDQLNTHFKQFVSSTAWGEGLTVHRKINWVDVHRHCSPHVIVVMAHDGAREAEFFEFPAYAMIPRLEKVVDLSAISVPSDDPGRANRSATVQSLDHLRDVISSVDGPKGENAMKHFRILNRMLRPSV